MKLIIEVQNLVKQYANIKVVDSTRFSFRQGICNYLSGYNETSKTNIIEILKDLQQPRQSCEFNHGLPIITFIKQNVCI